MYSNAKLPSRRNFLKGLAALPFAMSLPRQASGDEEIMSSGLNNALADGGKYFGTAVRINQLRQLPQLRAAVIENCGFVTPEIDLKWAALEWNEGEYNFGPVDDLLNFTESHGIKVHGHTLLWFQSVPKWAAAHMLSKPGDWSIIARYMKAVLGRYSDRITQWDVVNEVIDTTEKNSLRRNVFYKAFGPDYIGRALDEARSHAPNAKLLINEYSLEYDNPVDHDRRKAVLKLLESLKKQGKPLNGLGIQAHLDLSKGPLQKRIIKSFLNEVSQLGLEIFISELDVQEDDMSLSQASRDHKVSDEVKNYLEIALEVPSVKGVTTWGLSDEYSWLNSKEYKRNDITGSAKAENRGLPFDRNIRPKGVYFSMKDVFSKAATA